MLTKWTCHTKSESDLFFVYKKYLKQMFKTGLCIKKKHLLNLCSSVVNSQRLLCSQKAGVNCSY